MSPLPSSYRSAWKLWRLGAVRRLRPAGPTRRLSVDVSVRAWPASSQALASLTVPPDPRGWAVVSGTADRRVASPVATTLQRVGIGTLELASAADGAGLEERAERLLEALRWLGRHGEVASRSAGALELGMVGWHADAAPALVAAASGGARVTAVVAVGGRYDGLDESGLARLTAPVRLIAARGDHVGLREAWQVAGWLAVSAAHEVVGVPGAAGEMNSAGWRHARWLTGTWLHDHLALADARHEPAVHGRGRLWLAKHGLALLPLGAFAATAWIAGSPVTRAAVAAPVRRWAGVETVDSAGVLPLVLRRLEAQLPATINLSSLSGPTGFRGNGIAAFDYAGHAVVGGRGRERRRLRRSPRRCVLCQRQRLLRSELRGLRRVRDAGDVRSLCV